MPASKHFILYSTSHCHLCEQAEALLVACSNKQVFTWHVAEIADDSVLLNRYELTIPVLKRLDNDTEISWPFTEQDILSLLANPINTLP